MSVAKMSSQPITYMISMNAADPSRPIRTPLGVFMTADMLELAQAHASYRFVVRDEETDEKRILVS